MKRTLTILALTLTSSMADIDASLLTSNAKQLNTETKSEIVTREVRTFRSVRESREVPKIRNIKIREVPSFRLTRTNRQIRENRFIAQKTRESRKIRYVLIQDKVHFASLK